jgi:hypothetical protein
MSLRCAMASLVVLAGAPAGAPAHDIYTSLRTKYGTPCCDHSDCRPAPYRIAAQGVQMLVQQEWIIVPPDAIQYRVLSGDSGETAGGHWCGRHVVHDPYEIGHFTFCAILPPRLATSGMSGAR